LAMILLCRRRAGGGDRSARRRGRFPAFRIAPAI
jgi:hypothetical protein